MENKKFFGGVLAIVLVFGVCLLGCASSPASTTSYYNLGDVSEDNCALIQVSSIVNRNTEHGWPFADLVQIDGQGNPAQWQKPRLFKALRHSSTPG